MKWALGALVALLMGLLLAEGVVRFMGAGADRFGALILLPYDVVEPIRVGRAVDAASSYLVFDRDLGWQVGPDRHGHNGLYNSNAAGERLSTGASSGDAWATAFGDSFTHGDDVGDEETWVSQLAAHGLPTINAAVPGYGVDQAWLRYRRLKGRVLTHIILIGVMADNIGRHLNRYRPFITPAERIYFVKPRFESGALGLMVLASPFQETADYQAPDATLQERLFDVGHHDRFFDARFYSSSALDHSRLYRIAHTLALKPTSHAEWRPLYADPSALDLTLAIVKGFADEVRADGRQAVIVFLPERTVAEDVLQGRVPPTSALVSNLKTMGYPLVDLSEPVTGFIKDAAASESFLPHYSPALSRAVAAHIAEWKKAEKSLP